VRPRPPPNLAIYDANRAYRHVVCPEIEGRTAAQIETGMVPVASEDTVFDAPVVKRKTHMAAVAYFAESPDANEATSRVVHAVTPARIRDERASSSTAFQVQADECATRRSTNWS
jgi:hypothetical protein